MKASQRNLSLSVLTLAVRGALAAMAVLPLAAMADDAPSAADQVNAHGSIEVGGHYVSDSSAKFGEYNGLDKHGFDFTSSFSLNGGDAYGQGDGTTRWSVTGSDLGSSSREIGAAVSNQGKWSFSIDYDELQHNIDDSYQTPYQGKMGGNTFTLPQSFGVLDTTRTTGLGATAMTASQLGAFHPEDVYSKRGTTSLKAGAVLSNQLSLDFDYKHIDQSGAKLIGSGTDVLNMFDTSGSGFNWGAEKVAILMNPTKYQTDNFNLALNWKGDSGFFSAGYYGSLFHDQYSGVNFSNPWVAANRTTGLGAAPNGTDPGAAFPVDSMATPPSNQFHQLNLSGGYFFSPMTKLAGGISYAHNTQNMSYDGSYTPGTVTLPSGVNSLDASVNIKHADLKLTHRATNALDLAAGYTFNERDSKTSSYLYDFLNLGGESATVANIPLSWKHHQLDLSGNYRISSRQRISAAYNYDRYQRWCNADVSLYPKEAPADGSTYPAATSCAQVPKETTNMISLDYKLRATDAVNLKAGYSHAKRKSDVNASFYSPLQSNSEGYEDLNYLAFFQASRKENKAKLGVDWQATENLDVNLSGKYSKDDYDVTYGVQQGSSNSINLDASYKYSESNSVDAYLTSQHRKRDMENANGRIAGTDPTSTYINNLSDKGLTLGIGAKQKSLMGGRFELAEDLTYSRDHTDITADENGLACSVTLCGPGTIKSTLTSFKITGSYQVDKASRVLMGYQFQHLKTDDPAYAGFQLGYNAGRLPSDQQSPNYNVHVVSLFYDYTF